MKLLIPTNPTRSSEGDIGFSVYIAGLVQSGVSLISLENLNHLNISSDKLSALEGFDNPYKQALKTQKVLMEKNNGLLIDAFTEMGVGCELQNAGGIPEEETIEASRFADLLLLAESLSFSSGEVEEKPTGFAEAVLMHSQCAVLVMPKTNQEINEVFFTSNGSFSSMFALRQFTYLFPQFRDQKVTVLYVKENEDELAYHQRNIKAYLKHHYTNLNFKVLDGNPSAAIRSHLSKQKNCIVTFGAYGRSKFSQFFKRSKADNILNELDIPVFITHP